MAGRTIENPDTQDDRSLFESCRSVRTFENVVQQIRGLISEGRLRPGDKLPPERDLSLKLGVGRNAVREGLRALEQAGIITLKAGKGGGASVTSGRPAVIVENMRDLLYLGSITFDNLWETRLLLTDVVIQLAAQNMTQEDFELLEANVARAHNLFDSGKLREKSRCNIDFHDTLAAATHNPMIQVFMSSLSDLVRNFTERLGSDPSDDTLASRKRFLAALKRQDIPAAQKEMRADLLRVHDFYQQLSRDADQADAERGAKFGLSG